MTVNEIIKSLREGKLESPNELADNLIILSASLMTAYGFETDAEIEFAAKWEDIKYINPEYSDKRVDMKVKTFPIYKTLRQAKASIKTMEEVIRALKKKLQNLDTERRELQHY